MTSKLTLSQLEDLHSFNKIYAQVNRDEGMSLIHAAHEHTVIERFLQQFENYQDLDKVATLVKERKAQHGIK